MRKEISELDDVGSHSCRADDCHYHAAALHLKRALLATIQMLIAMTGYRSTALPSPTAHNCSRSTLTTGMNRTARITTTTPKAVPIWSVRCVFFTFVCNDPNGSATTVNGLSAQTKTPTPFRLLGPARKAQACTPIPSPGSPSHSLMSRCRKPIRSTSPTTYSTPYWKASKS